MIISLIIAAGVVISGFIATWMGIELAFYPPKNDRAIRKVRIALGCSCLALLAFTLWATVRGEEAMRDLPKQVAEYLKTLLPAPAPAVEKATTGDDKQPPGKTGKTGKPATAPAQYPAVDFDLTPEEINHTLPADHVPSLILRIRNRGTADIEDVRLRVTEYDLALLEVKPGSAERLPGDKIKITHAETKLIIQKSAKAGEDSLDIKRITAGHSSDPMNLADKKPFKFLTPPNEATAPGSIGIYYALRFTFIDSSAGTRYVHYQIIAASVPYLLPLDNPHMGIIRQGDMSAFSKPANLIVSDQRSLYGSYPEEGYPKAIQAQTPQSPQPSPAPAATPPPMSTQDNSVHVDSRGKIEQNSKGDCSPNIVGGSTTVNCVPTSAKVAFVPMYENRQALSWTNYGTRPPQDVFESQYKVVVDSTFPITELRIWVVNPLLIHLNCDVTSGPDAGHGGGTSGPGGGRCVIPSASGSAGIVTMEFSSDPGTPVVPNYECVGGIKCPH